MTDHRKKIDEEPLRDYGDMCPKMSNIKASGGIDRICPHCAAGRVASPRYSARLLTLFLSFWGDPGMESGCQLHSPRLKKCAEWKDSHYPRLAIVSLATIAVYTFTHKHCTKTSKGHSLWALPRMISIFHKTMFIN